MLAEHEALAEAAARSRRSRFRVGLATVPAASDELIARDRRSWSRDTRGCTCTCTRCARRSPSRGCTRGDDSIEYAARAGLLDAQVLAAHCVWLDDTDVGCCARHDVAVAHNPVSNMILASGVAPVPRLLREGVTVGLGVDGPASNDSQDMLETMKIAALLQKVHHLQATGDDRAAGAASMATIGGARALGHGRRGRRAGAGQAADLVLFAEPSPSLSNMHDPYQELVYCASAAGRATRSGWTASRWSPRPGAGGRHRRSCCRTPASWR